jgi:dethiobiotin synthetase
MTTLTLKLKTKRDATKLFDFAKKANIDMVVVENGLGTINSSSLTTSEIAYLKRLRKVAIEIKSGNFKGQSVKSFLDEV